MLLSPLIPPSSLTSYIQCELFCELGVIIFCMEDILSWLVFMVAKLRYAVGKRVKDRLSQILWGDAEMSDGVLGGSLPGDTSVSQAQWTGGVFTCYSKCGPQTGSVSLDIIWEFIRNMKPQPPHPQHLQTESLHFKIISLWFTRTSQVEKHWSRLGLLRETRRFQPLWLHPFQTSLTSQKHGKTLAGGRAHDPPTSWKDSSLLLVQGRTYDQPLTTIAVNSDEGSNPLSLSRNLWVVSAGSTIYLECASIIPTRYLVLGITRHTYQVPHTGDQMGANWSETLENNLII